jgi:general stress protein CsbA
MIAFFMEVASALNFGWDFYIGSLDVVSFTNAFLLIRKKCNFIALHT